MHAVGTVMSVELADGTVESTCLSVEAIDGYQDICGAAFGHVKAGGRHLLVDLQRIAVTCEKGSPLPGSRRGGVEKQNVYEDAPPILAADTPAAVSITGQTLDTDGPGCARRSEAR